MDKINYLTKEGMKKLQDELHELKTKGRAEIAVAMQEAREKGDLSENAEYESAKAAQQLLEIKISKLNATLLQSRVIDSSKLDSSKVIILSTVTIENKQNNKISTYQIVAEEEADLKLKKISVKSPIGKSLLGKKVGQIANVKTPTGTIKYKILSISVN